MRQPLETRRTLIKAGLAVPATLTLGRVSWATTAPLEPTPACDAATIPTSAGPFFKPDSPARASLREPGLAGTPLVLTGRVLSTDCRPIERALLDFWQADDEGAYDNAGQRLRGHQWSDARGGYALESILPAGYGSRTRHIHVKVQAPGQPVLTTELYFPGEERNARDSLFRPQLLVSLADAPAGKAARFDFVLALA